MTKLEAEMRKELFSNAQTENPLDLNDLEFALSGAEVFRRMVLEHIALFIDCVQIKEDEWDIFDMLHREIKTLGNKEEQGE